MVRFAHFTITGSAPLAPMMLALGLHMIKRSTIFIIILLLSGITLAGNWFPEDYKTFSFQEGDILASQQEDGKYRLNKVLRIDKVILKEGDSINIQGQIFTAPEEDFLLIISMSCGEADFATLDDAIQAAKIGKWNVIMEHAPSRSPGAAAGQVLVGHQPVSDSELAGYNQWKKLFETGKAGVF